MGQPDTGTELAYERTFLAHERTQMAWIRTALSLISFGFTIAKFFELVREKLGESATLLDSQTVGTVMISTGLLALTLASLQHYLAMKRLHGRCPDLPRSLSWITSMLLAILGLVALCGSIVRT